MYTGTLVMDLIAMVDDAQRKADERRRAEEAELRAIFAMQIPVTDSDPILMGAA